MSTASPRSNDDPLRSSLGRGERSSCRAQPDVPFKYTGWDVDSTAIARVLDSTTGKEFGLEQAQNSEALLLGRVYEVMQVPKEEAEAGRILSSTIQSPHSHPE